MRIFFCGLRLCLAVGLFIVIVFPDTVEEYSSVYDELLIAAFICGACSQAIKQFKGEDQISESDRKN